jgi:hypothetical protein
MSTHLFCEVKIKDTARAHYLRSLHGFLRILHNKKKCAAQSINNSWS